MSDLINKAEDEGKDYVRDTFKALVDDRPPPPAQQTLAPPEKTRSKDPYVGLRYSLQLGSVEIAYFSECSAITIELETMDYIEGGLNSYVHKLPVRTKYSNITLKRGVDEGQDLFRWFMLTTRGEIKPQHISIILHDQEGYVVRRWNLQNAYPVKWTGPDLKTDGGAVAVESIEFTHEGLLPTGDQKELRQKSQYTRRTSSVAMRGKNP